MYFSLLGISNQIKNNFDIDNNYKEIESINYVLLRMKKLFTFFKKSIYYK